jgi:transcriptional regulator
MADQTSSDGAMARANLAEHLKNIDIACEDARLSAVEKIRRIKEEIEKAQNCLKLLSS